MVFRSANRRYGGKSGTRERWTPACVSTRTRAVQPIRPGKRFAKRLSDHGYKATLLNVHPTQKEINPAIAKPTIAKPTIAKPIPGTGSYLTGYDVAIFLFMPAVGRAKMAYVFIPLSGSKVIAPMQGVRFATSDQKLLWRSPMPVVNPGNRVPIEGDDQAALFRAIDSALKDYSGEVETHFFSAF